MDNEEKSVTHPTIYEQAVELVVSDIDWVIRKFVDGGWSYHIGELKHQGGYIAVVDTDFSSGFYQFKDFKALASNDSGQASTDLPRKLLRDVCHKLGIETFEGHNVDQYFRDEDWENPKSSSRHLRRKNERPIRGEWQNPQVCYRDRS